MSREGSTTPRSLAGGGLELLGIELLEEHARHLAALLSLARRRRGRGRAHLRRLSEDARRLRDTYTALAADAHRESVSPAAEWLLDNFHSISAAVRDMHHDLPPSFFRRLPWIATDEFAGLPRVHALALELIRASAGRLDAQRLHRFITAFQSVTPLTIGELWAWPSALKLALIEHLRVRADALAESRAHHQHADRLAGTLEAGAAPTERFPADVHPAFVTRLLQRSREYGASAAALLRELDAALAARGQTVEDAIRSEGRYQASEQATMANLIGSLRLISSFDWSEFFESVSLVEQVLQRDPAGVYSRMDFRSRDRYRHAVEELAEPTGDAQLRVALKSVERARQIGAKAPADRGTHVGYHLIGNGRRAFEESVAWTPTCGERIRRLFFSYATPGYLGTIAVFTAVLVGAALWLRALARLAGCRTDRRRSAHGGPGERVRDPDPAAHHQRADPAAAAAATRARSVPATCADDGDRADDARSAWTRSRSSSSHLEVQALGNVDPHIHFAVLSDFRDAATETLPRDAEILEAARAGIDALNQKHGDGRSDRFFLFHRLRQWNEARRPLDGMGAQARQDRGVQSPAARRHRHELRRAGRRPARSCQRCATASRSTAIRACRAMRRSS